MSLLIPKNALFEIKVSYIQHQNEELEILPDTETPDPKALVATFTFKRPNWKEAKEIMSSAVTMSATGATVVDPYKFMDMKIKMLLKDWSLAEENGDRIPVTAQNIGNLHPAMVQELFKRVEAHLGNKDEK